MKLTLWDPEKTAYDAAAVMVFEDDSVYTDEHVVKTIQKASEAAGFDGKAGSEFLYLEPEASAINIKKLLLVGCGKKEKATLETYRAFAGKALQSLVKKKIKTVTIISPDVSKTSIEADRLTAALFEGAYLANHSFKRYKSEDTYEPAEDIVVAANAEFVEKQSELPERIKIIAEGSLWAREWVSMPSNDKYPELLAKIYKETAEKHSKNIKVTIFNDQYLEENGYGALSAVGQGSDHKQRLLVMEYTPENGADNKPYVLIGKGVTFDTGGINLKSTSGLEHMKMDMGGSAAAAGALIALARLNYPKRVAAVIPLAENMPSGNATRTGDVIKTLNGKFVEITNTDAEGRLILADAITHTVRELDPEFIIDLATLTGACVVALGENMAGLFSSDNELADHIFRAGETTHERCWRLPLPDDYIELMKSDVADMRNTGKVAYGGAITAALFLKSFTEDVKWAHIDIAGPAMAKKGGAYSKPGGTGFGVRLLVEALTNMLSS